MTGRFGCPTAKMAFGEDEKRQLDDREGERPNRSFQLAIGEVRLRANRA